MRKLLSIAAAAAAAASLLGSPAQAARTEAYEYYGTPGDGFILDCDGSLKVSGAGMGGLCFDIWRDDATVTITTADDSGKPVFGFLRFRKGTTNVGDPVPFCGTTGTLTVPRDAAGPLADRILVWTRQAGGIAAGCNAATHGTMTASYTAI